MSENDTEIPLSEKSTFFPERNLKRIFSKKFAPAIRQETAKKLKEVRRFPKNYTELKKYKGQLLADKNTADIIELKQKMKHDIIGRIFKTLQYKELNRKITYRLSGERSHRMRNIYEGFDKILSDVLNKCPLNLFEGLIPRRFASGSFIYKSFD